LDKTYYFLDKTLRQLHCARRQALPITSDKKEALPVGRSTPPQYVGASQHRSCRKAPRLGLG
jgi:hypothetical protein